MSYNQKEAIQQLYKGHAVKAEMILPEGVGGYNPDYRSSIAYNPLLANKLLDRFGYKKGVDGYRTLPDGKPLVLKMNSTSLKLFRYFCGAMEKEPGCNRGKS